MDGVGHKFDLDSVPLIGIAIVDHDGDGGADEQFGLSVDVQHFSLEGQLGSAVDGGLKPRGEVRAHTGLDVDVLSGL